MRKSTKIWLGILTFLPIIFIIIYFGGIVTVLLTQIPELEKNTGEFPPVFLSSFLGLIFFLFLALSIRIGLMIYFIVHVSDNDKNDTTKKIMWILILIFIGSIGNIVYYFLEIFPSDRTLKKISENLDLD